MVYSSSGHPDQAPYIDVWIDIAADKPGYIKKCLCPNKKKILLAQPPTAPKKKPSSQAPVNLYPVLPDAPRTFLLNHPGLPLIGLPHQLGEGGEAQPLGSPHT